MAEMLAITTPPTSYSTPSAYQLSTLPSPVISSPTDVLIAVHAASVNPVDVKLAAGIFKLILTDDFPYKIGFDCAGVVTEVGEGVRRVGVGDEVYARLPEVSRGSWSEVAVCDEYYVARKPASLSFAEAAALPLAAVTALQALRLYKGGLEGKTVFVPAGLGGTGAYACQLAKNVFRAGTVITTVSTAKVGRVGELLGEGVVDRVIDYTRSDPMKAIPPRSVDFILDTTGQAMQFLSLMVPSTGTIISISTLPSGDQLQDSSLMLRPGNPRLPWLMRVFLNTTDAIRRVRARRWSVEYRYMFLESNAKDLEILGGYVEERRVLPVVGMRVDLRDIEKVREAAGLVYNAKGGPVGKIVFEVVKD